VPRLVRATADENPVIREFAQNALKMFPGAKVAYEESVACPTCGNRVHSSKLAEHQLRHKLKKLPLFSARKTGRRRSTSDSAPAIQQGGKFQRERPSYWEWDMTTINTPKYRRR
jgi:hypothetical protein